MANYGKSNNFPVFPGASELPVKNVNADLSLQVPSSTERERQFDGQHVHSAGNGTGRHNQPSFNPADSATREASSGHNQWTALFKPNNQPSSYSDSTTQSNYVSGSGTTGQSQSNNHDFFAAVLKSTQTNHSGLGGVSDSNQPPSFYPATSQYELSIQPDPVQTMQANLDYQCNWIRVPSSSYPIPVTSTGQFQPSDPSTQWDGAISDRYHSQRSNSVPESCFWQTQQHSDVVQSGSDCSVPPHFTEICSRVKATPSTTPADKITRKREIDKNYRAREKRTKTQTQDTLNCLIQEYTKLRNECETLKLHIASQDKTIVQLRNYIGANLEFKRTEQLVDAGSHTEEPNKWSKLVKIESVDDFGGNKERHGGAVAPPSPLSSPCSWGNNQF